MPLSNKIIAYAWLIDETLILSLSYLIPKKLEFNNYRATTIFTKYFIIVEMASW